MLAPKEVRHLRRVVEAPRRRPARCGIEHEYTVLEPDGSVADFRDLIHTLAIPGRRLDPMDRNAYRCRWGGVVTADGREAEIATPPIGMAVGFAGAVVDAAVGGRAFLEGMLPTGLTLQGYSTHINVSVPDGRVVRAARLFAAHFAAAAMLMIDRPTSPGLLVRPRRGRLEVGGEFLDGDGLRAAVLMVAGGALACARKVSRYRLPEPLSAVTVPTIERFGVYVDRRAYGPDLYEHGRGTLLTTASGQVRSAQRHLEECWTIARGAIRPFADPADIALVEDIVDGRRPLPGEDQTRNG